MREHADGHQTSMYGAKSKIIAILRIVALRCAARIVRIASLGMPTRLSAQACCLLRTLQCTGVTACTKVPEDFETASSSSSSRLLVPGVGRGCNAKQHVAIVRSLAIAIRRSRKHECLELIDTDLKDGLPLLVSLKRLRAMSVVVTGNKAEC